MECSGPCVLGCQPFAALTTLLRGGSDGLSISLDTFSYSEQKDLPLVGLGLLCSRLGECRGSVQGPEGSAVKRSTVSEKELPDKEFRIV